MNALSNDNLKPSGKLGKEALEGISEMLRMLAEPARLALLQELKDGEKTVGELAAELEIGQPSVSKHLGILAGANLVTRRKEGVKVHYSLHGTFVFPLCQLVCEKLSADQKNRAMIDFSI